MCILNDRDKAKVCEKRLDQVVPLSFSGSTFGSSPGAVTKEPGLHGSQGVLPNGKARLSCQEKDEEALTRGRERKEAAQRQEAACTPVARGGAGIRPGGVRPSWGEGGCDLTVFLLGTHHSVTWRPLALLHAGCAGPLFQPTCTCCEGPRASLSCLL